MSNSYNSYTEQKILLLFTAFPSVCFVVTLMVFITLILTLKGLLEKSFENIVGKGEKAGCQPAIYPFPKKFSNL